MRSLAFLALSLVACAADVEDRASSAHLGETQQAITGGTASTAADDAVVRVALASGSFCSGTLLTSNLVLTARHCVAQTSQNGNCPAFGKAVDPATVSITTGLQAKSATPVAKGKTIFTETASGCGTDIALVLLDRAVPNAKTLKVRSSAPTKGETARAVGYGFDGATQTETGRFSKANLTIEGIGPTTMTWVTNANQQIPVTIAETELVTGEAICQGDNGGPLLDAQGNVFGVAAGSFDNCADAPSVFTSVGAHATLIQTAVTAAGNAGTSTPTTSPTKTGNTTTGDEGDTGDEPSGTTTPRSAASPTESSGCSASPAPRSSFAPALLAVAALVVARRRRRP